MNNPESQLNHPQQARWDKHLALFLRFIGGFALLAFLAAVMPASWIVATAEELGFDPFPNSPLTFYLARNLSLLYGFVGALLMIVANNVPHYRGLIHFIALGTILFGLLQLIVDAMSGLPGWWTLGESLSTLGGGVSLYWVQHRAAANVKSDGRLDLDR
jgi:hypothetical protein